MLHIIISRDADKQSHPEQCKKVIPETQCKCCQWIEWHTIERNDSALKKVPSQSKYSRAVLGGTPIPSVLKDKCPIINMLSTFLPAMILDSIIKR